MCLSLSPSLCSFCVSVGLRGEHTTLPQGERVNSCMSSINYCTIGHSEGCLTDLHGAVVTYMVLQRCEGERQNIAEAKANDLIVVIHIQSKLEHIIRAALSLWRC